MNFILNDYNAIKQNKKYSFVYDKFQIALQQKLQCGLYAGQIPNETQLKNGIVIRPIYNIMGMGYDTSIVYTIDEFYTKMKQGYFWVEYISGMHTSIDLVIENGKIKFYCILECVKSSITDFLYFHPIPIYLPKSIYKYINTYLYDYTGFLNIEMIDKYIIEMHLRIGNDYYHYTNYFLRQCEYFYKTGKFILSKHRKLVKDIYIVPFLSKHFIKLKEKNKQKIEFILDEFSTKGDIIVYDKKKLGYRKKRLFIYTLAKKGYILVSLYYLKQYIDSLL
jgi:hypothetical protein